VVQVDLLARRPTILENVDKASTKMRLDADNVAGVYLPVFKTIHEGSGAGALLLPYSGE
jgi:hypothetical protein